MTTRRVPGWWWLAAVTVVSAVLWRVALSNPIATVAALGTVWALTSRRADTWMVDDPDRPGPTRESLDALSRTYTDRTDR